MSAEIPVVIESKLLYMAMKFSYKVASRKVIDPKRNNFALIFETVFLYMKKDRSKNSTIENILAPPNGVLNRTSIVGLKNRSVKTLKSR